MAAVDVSQLQQPVAGPSAACSEPEHLQVMVAAARRGQKREGEELAVAGGDWMTRGLWEGGRGVWLTWGAPWNY